MDGGTSPAWIHADILRFLSPSLAMLLLLTGSSVADTGVAENGDVEPQIHRLLIGQSVLDVTIAPGELAVTRAVLVEWVRAAAIAVHDYYGRFPVKKANLSVTLRNGKGVITGRSIPGSEPLVIIAVGQRSRIADLREDWVLVHELVHLAFPSVHPRHHWIEEGLSTYIEPLARVEAGALNPEKVWEWLLFGLPKGLPSSGDRGLDYTPTWGRTYWGGALFCFVADVQIRERTGNRYSLKDALRAIVEAGGTMQVSWPLMQAFEIGDLATGVAVLVPLYNQWKAQPVDVDLAQLWLRLGVAKEGERIVLDDRAPQAWLRRAITGTPAADT